MSVGLGDKANTDRSTTLLMAFCKILKKVEDLVLYTEEKYPLLAMYLFNYERDRETPDKAKRWQQ